MPSINIKRCLFGVMLLILLTHLAFSQAQQGTLVDKIIAKVDDQIVLLSDLEREYQLYQAQDGTKLNNSKPYILESILMNKMLLAKAKTEGVTIKKEEVEERLDYKMKEILSQVGSETNLEQYTGKSIGAFQQELRKLIKEQLTIARMRSKIVDELSITPKEVRTFFGDLVKDSLPNYPAEVKVRQIVRYPTVKQQDKVAIIEKLRSLKARAQAGESFRQLAEQHSEDPGSSGNGGELGFWKLGELVPAYEATALALKPGEISEPIETQFGFHLIQLIERQKGRYNTRHILIKVPDSSLDLQEAIDKLAHIRTEVLANHITFEKAAQKYSEDTATAHQGGLLTDCNSNCRMPIAELPPEISTVVEKLAPGAISEPMIFTAAGKQAARIIYFQEYIPPHQANLRQDYEKIAQMALEHKKAMALNQWFENVKAEANLTIDPAYQDISNQQ